MVLSPSSWVAPSPPRSRVDREAQRRAQFRAVAVSGWLYSPSVSRPPVTADDLYRFRWVDHPRLSPDGSRLAYQLSWADEEARENRAEVLVRGLDPGSAPVRVGAGTRRDHSPEWSPDGTLLLFLSRRGARDQLLVVGADGSAERLLSAIPDGVGNAAWSPDGSLIAFTAMILGDPGAVVDDPRPPESPDHARRPPVARVARRLDHKHDGAGYGDGRHSHLFVIPAAGGEALQLTDGAWSVEAFDWAPDGLSLVVAGDAEADPDLRRENHLYTVPVAGGRLRHLVGGLEISEPRWSPTGEQVAFIAPRGEGGGRHERLWLVAAGGGEPRCLTAGFDQSVGGSVISDMRSGHGTRLCWREDGGRVLFQASSRGTAAVHSADLDGEVRIELAAEHRGVFDFDLRGAVLAAAVTDLGTPVELIVVREGVETRVTDSNPWLAEREVATPERHEFTAPDGLRLEGWLMKPPGFDPGRRHPLVMEIHGGPHAQYGWAFFHEFQVLAGLGFLVFYLNPRGSDGYGEDFKREVARDWGGRDYVDLMTALDQLIERTGCVDEARMGVGGGSYGGFMTNWVIGHTDRFAAAVSMRSISNLVSEFAQHDVVLWGILEMGPPPWPDPEELWQRSPIRYVRDIHTPLLLTTGRWTCAARSPKPRSCSGRSGCWAGRSRWCASRVSRTICPGAAGPTAGSSGCSGSPAGSAITCWRPVPSRRPWRRPPASSRAVVGP